MSRRWYALYSHTGEEIKNISRLLKIQPWEVFTNNKGCYDINGIPSISGTAKIINQLLCTAIPDGSVVTLNGYMRIIPENVLRYADAHNITYLNIHPAPIDLYPELRGADPQIRLYEGINSGKYDTMGVVIHRVDTGVDTGEIVYRIHEPVTANVSLSYVYSRLHQLGTIAWCAILPTFLELEV